MTEISTGSNEEYLDDRNTQEKAFKQAIAESEIACVWLKDYFLKLEVEYLGSNISRIYKKYYCKLKCHDEITRLAIKCYWIYQRKLELKRDMDQAACQNDKINVKNNTYDSDEDMEYFYFFLGEEESLFDEYFCNELKLEVNKNYEKTSWQRNFLLIAIALHFFGEADRQMQAGNLVGAFDAVSYAFAGIKNSEWDETWCLGYDFSDETHKDDIRRKAQEKAYVRHASTYERRQQVIDYWRTHIYPADPMLSNDKAAEWLRDTFDDLSIRKLSEYVGQAKKEIKIIPPAGKA